jgi:dTDP-4-amino-4,6-dideoxygalactose transaminase
MNVPFVDLKTQYQDIKNEVDCSIQEVINETAFISGKYAEIFENNFSKIYGVNNCISCANGTDAIYIALKALGIGVDDEVITVANTWISTAETISQTGAEPVFVDIDSKTYNIDYEKIEDKITNKTKAIIPVHLFGQAVNMIELKKIADKYNLMLIEDCAQAHFAEYNGQKVGTFGDIATFSFYPGKNLGAYGDAGAIITNNNDLADKCRMFANHGALKKHFHHQPGINSRMDGIQAAVLNVKLKYILNWTSLRVKNASIYNNLLKDVEGVAIPEVMNNATHVYHLYVIRVQNRKHIMELLNSKGIGLGIHYPTPLPFLDAYSYKNHQPSDFPVAWEYKDQILSLPMYPELTHEMIEYVSDQLNVIHEAVI